MPGNERYEKGLALRKQLFGEDYLRRMEAETYAGDAVMQKFRDLAAETIFGALWTRPGLDLKTRTLVCVVSDTATGRFPELALHLRMALRQGWSEDELTEVLLQLSAYVGAPLVREAMQSASEVFAAVREEAGAPAGD